MTIFADNFTKLLKNVERIPTREEGLRELLNGLRRMLEDSGAAIAMLPVDRDEFIEIISGFCSNVERINASLSANLDEEGALRTQDRIVHASHEASNAKFFGDGAREVPPSYDDNDQRHRRPTADDDGIARRAAGEVPKRAPTPAEPTLSQQRAGDPGAFGNAPTPRPAPKAK